MCSKIAKFNNTCAASYVAYKSQVLADVKAICDGRRQCNISVKSIASDPCPFEKKIINVLYGCFVRQSVYSGTYSFA